MEINIFYLLVNCKLFRNKFLYLHQIIKYTKNNEWKRSDSFIIQYIYNLKFNCFQIRYFDVRKMYQHYIILCKTS